MSIFDENGKYVPWGSIERKRVEPFVATSVLPAFLSIYDSAGATNGWAMGSYLSTEQWVQVNTSTVVDTFAVVNINDNRGTSVSSGGGYRLDLMEIRLGIDGVIFSHDQTLLDFGINCVGGNNTGAKFGCTNADGCFFEARGAGNVITKVPFEFNVLQNAEWALPHNLELAVRPDRYVVLFENGDVVAYHQFTAAQMGIGLVNPKFALWNRLAGTARWMRFGQMSLTLCH